MSDNFSNDENLQARQRLKSFEDSVFLHTPILLRVATRMCKKSGEADDVVQETLLRAWKYWDSFEQGTNCRAWLFRIMVNVVQRRRETIAATAEHVSVEEPTISNVLKFEPKMEFDESGAIAAIEKLPSEYKDVIVLVLVEEFSYKEVSAMLDIPMGTVMSRLHRARLMIKKMLKPLWGEQAASI
ncbi:MAG: sigma-70 family RNA polymerase sigma factor [Blastocatellia bacterium]|nr:sigma-70 family RNA polymerase sigma factor [Blastocatellia bacterium]